jgi:hypothetical protein
MLECLYPMLHSCMVTYLAVSAWRLYGRTSGTVGMEHWDWWPLSPVMPWAYGDYWCPAINKQYALDRPTIAGCKAGESNLEYDLKVLTASWNSGMPDKIHFFPIYKKHIGHPFWGSWVERKKGGSVFVHVKNDVPCLFLWCTETYYVHICRT